MATRDNGGTKFETVRYEKKGAVCHIILNRPEKLNAANDRLVEDVNDALFEFDADSELKVAILSGAGRAFCSGADVQQRQLRTREELRRLGGPAGRRSREKGPADAGHWEPVNAAVHGHAPRASGGFGGWSASERRGRPGSNRGARALNWREASKNPARVLVEKQKPFSRGGWRRSPTNGAARQRRAAPSPSVSRISSNFA